MGWPSLRTTVAGSALPDFLHRAGRFACDAVEMMRERAQAKNLELVVEVSSETPRFVHTDPGKFRQVLANLGGTP